jgi:hypothetical protein
MLVQTRNLVPVQVYMVAVVRLQLLLLFCRYGVESAVLYAKHVILRAAILPAKKKSYLPSASPLPLGCSLGDWFF